MVINRRVNITKRDCAIIARALETASVAMIGDVVGGSDTVLAYRIARLVAHFEEKAKPNVPATDD